MQKKVFLGGFQTQTLWVTTGTLPTELFETFSEHAQIGRYFDELSTNQFSIKFDFSKPEFDDYVKKLQS